MLGAQIFTVGMSSSWIDPLITMSCPSLNLIIFFILRSILSDMRIATPAFYCFRFALNIFFNPFTFSLYVSLGLKWVSCKQHISSVQVSRSVVSNPLRPQESQHARPPCRSPTPGVHSNSCPLSR